MSSGTISTKSLNYDNYMSILNDGIASGQDVILKNAKTFESECELVPGNVYFRRLEDVSSAIHPGICVYDESNGKNMIIDVCGGRIGTDGIEHAADLISFEDFSNGNTVYEVYGVVSERLFQKESKIYESRDRQETIAIAWEYLDKKLHYDEMGFNCAQFAFFCLFTEFDHPGDVPFGFGQLSQPIQGFKIIARMFGPLGNFLSGCAWAATDVFQHGSNLIPTPKHTLRKK